MGLGSTSARKKIQELRHKLAHHIAIGVPRPHGEIVLVSDGSDVGGGSTIFHRQTVEKEQIPTKLQTMGVKNDGKLKHTYPENYRLVSLGHWNWKWNPARSKYSTYEQELLGGVLTISRNYRFLSNLPIIWLCDNEAVRSFLDNPPPNNKRQRR